ncbi:MAG TPA: metal-dependent transcriptional regulator [Candidatus Sulfotelmatobacter sp.]|nr:metal-dependent transcriptional regulator [Candidatus Sulfotelmatobacter sp.]
MVSRRAALSRSRQDYLKALYRLGRTEPAISTSRLAAQLGVAAPSVTNMLRRLAGERLVRHRAREGAWLSARGEREALRIVRRHRILETFLVRVLGLDWSEVHEDAEILEHHVSERVLRAIDRLMRHPREDPHGHPIPDASGRLRRRRLQPLARLPVGRSAIVREIQDDDRRRMARWRAAGLVPGARVRMRSARLDDDVFEIEVGRRRLSVGSEGLAGILIQPARRAS